MLPELVYIKLPNQYPATSHNGVGEKQGKKQEQKEAKQSFYTIFVQLPSGYVMYFLKLGATVVVGGANEPPISKVLVVPLRAGDG